MDAAIKDLLDAIRRMAENYEGAGEEVIVDAEEFGDVLKCYDKVRFMKDRELARLARLSTQEQR